MSRVDQSHPDSAGLDATALVSTREAVELAVVGEPLVPANRVAGYTMDYVGEHGFPQSPANVLAAAMTVAERTGVRELEARAAQ